MTDLIRKKCEKKSIVLLGFGREGQATYRLLRNIFPEKLITISDKNHTIKDNPLIAGDHNVKFLLGGDYLKNLDDFDIIFRSPGIPIWNLKPSIPSDKITSQTDLFLQAFGLQVIGITGSKGKSTSSSLIYHILKTAEKNALLVGNIGNPAFHYSELVTTSTWIVFELSSHQLEYINRSPHISILLNLFQEHLDAYSSYEAYQNAKWNIAKHQKENDFLIYNADDSKINRHIVDYFSNRRLVPFSLEKYLERGGYIREGRICFSDGIVEKPVWKIHQDRFLKGEHNLKNILAAVNTTMILELPEEVIAEGIETFKGLEHRLEYVGEYRHIHFYNDSIATVPEACIEAIKAIPGIDTLIAGGFDRGIDYSLLAGFINSSGVRNLIFVGAAGRRIGEELAKMSPAGKKIFFINRFDDFRDIAFRETKPGNACLLSPAAASYDEFNNFEERGKRFRELVKEKW